MVYLLMGVAGCGKSTIGRLLARKLDIPFYDADDFHSPDNILKMAQGMPLDDADRAPWLSSLAEEIVRWNSGAGSVLACSALKEAYRRMLSGSEVKDVVYIHLAGDRELIRRRLALRDDHYFPENLLESQYAALEPPSDGITVQIDTTPEEIIMEIVESLRRRGLCHLLTQWNPE